MITLDTNEGRTIRQATPPDVVANPRLKNYIWDKTSVPPASCVWSEAGGVWVCTDGVTNNGVVLTQLAGVVFSPESGSLAEGFRLSHETAGVTIFYTINGGPYQVYAGGVVLVATGYFYVAAYAAKSGYASSPLNIAEYVTRF